MMHPKFTAFIEKISNPQQGITQSLERLFQHTGLARTEHQGTSRKIVHPENAEQCIIIGSTQGKNPLTYIEVDANTHERTIRQVCMLPKQRHRSLIQTTLRDNEKVGQPLITQDSAEINSFLDDLHQHVEIRSQSRRIDLEVLPNTLDLDLNPSVAQEKLLVPLTPPTNFTQLFAYAAHVEKTPAHPTIDIRLLITQGHPALTEASLSEIEINALQAASNILFQELSLSSTPQLLPSVQKLIDILTQDNARPQVMSVFLSVFVEKIDGLTSM